MPITKSAKKALRSSEAKQKRNISQLKNLEINLKTVTKETLSKVISLVDKAAKNNLITDNKAARVKRKLMKTIGDGKLSPRSDSGKKSVSKTASKTKTTTAKPAAKKKTTAKKAKSTKK